MRSTFVAVAASVLIGWTSQLGATTYLVLPDGSGDFPTIQAAVDAAADGDVIELGEGTFRGEGNYHVFLSKGLAIRGASSDPERCIIDCEGGPSDGRKAFWILRSTPPSAILQDLTITRGYSEFSGGGVYCAASITFLSCIFVDNTCEDDHGGGVHCQEGSPTFINCRFEHNAALGYAGGGGVGVVYGQSPRFDHCSFIGNTANSGGACVMFEGGSAEFANCVFRDNAANIGGGFASGGGATAAFDHCTFTNNEGRSRGSGLSVDYVGTVALSHSIVTFNIGGAGVHCGDGSASLTCCDVFGNEGGDWVGCIADYAGIDGNLSLDPLLCDWPGGDLHLQLGSPCAPEYNPACGLIGALPVGCGQTPVERTTWGRLKAVFRE